MRDFYGKCLKVGRLENEGERDREGEGLDKLDGGQWQTSGNYSTDVLSLRRNEVVSLMQFKEETGVI